ncbi:MAG: NAD-dependent epimerase/dehydratase family protein, partial [Smithella sp.]|nr:NAD-dependent epimerase/dehydratase family protein [Smithella sp.]
MSGKNKLVLVTGATGAIGPRVVHALHQAGCQIRAFSVDAPAAGMFPQSVEVLIGDVTDQVAVQSAMQGVDAVVHLAALLHIVNPPPELREKYEHVNVGGTATVVEAAIKAGVGRVVLFSTIAVYGPSDGCVLNEMSPTHPDTFYAQTKRAAEQIVLNARSADGQPLGTVLR